MYCFINLLLANYLQSWSNVELVVSQMDEASKTREQAHVYVEEQNRR